jgi:hypothetical protein
MRAISKASNMFWSAAAVVVLSLAVMVNVIAVFEAMGLDWKRRHQYSEGSEYMSYFWHSLTTGIGYQEFDFPPSIIPLSEHPYNARLTVEDSVYYEPNATAEWHTLFPSGGGFVRLGPEYRLFGVSMFHQLHCLDKLRRAVVHDPPSEWERWHTQHCLNYVRQMLLCSSSNRLEPVKDVADGLKVDGLELEHTCRDWSVLRRIAEENFKDWPEGVYP